MDIRNLKDLCESYESIYAPDTELSEEQIWEEVEEWVNSLIEEGYDLSEYTWDEIYEAYLEEQLPPVPRTPSMRDMIDKGKSNEAFGAAARRLGISPQKSRNPSVPRTPSMRDMIDKGKSNEAFGAAARRLGVVPGSRPAPTSPAAPRGSSGASGGSSPAAARRGSSGASGGSSPAAAPRGSSGAAPRGSSGASGGGSTSRPAASSPRPTAPAAPQRASSPANASQADQIKGGSQVYDMQRKAGDFKAATETGKKTWAMANPKLANKPKTPNPLLGDNKLSDMAAASRERQKVGGANITSSNIADIRRTGQEAQNRASNAAPAGTALAKAQAETKKESIDWGSTSKLTDAMANAYVAVYEAKKVDQDEDGDNDFADVRIARLVAAGMSKEEAIAKVKNKSYNEGYDLDESRTAIASPGDSGKRRSKKIRGAKNEQEYMAGRSDAGKRISGNERVGPRYYTLGRSRGAGPDAPTKPGQRPKDTPKATKGELDYARKRHKDVSGKSWNRFGGQKGLPEDFELWISDLLDEGYDLSDYTWDEMFDIYEDYKPWDFGPKQKARAKYSQLVQRKEAGGSPRGTATRANKIFSVAREMRTTLDKNSAATGANPAKQGLQPATRRHTAAAIRGAGGGITATKAYNLKPLKFSSGGSSSLGGVGNASGTQRYTPGAGGRFGLAGTGLADEFELWVQELINEGYDLSDYTLDEMFEIYEETEEEKRKNERRARIAELQAQGRVMTSSRRTSARAKERKAEKEAEKLERMANAAIEATRGATRRSSRPMGSEQPARAASPGEANRRLSSTVKKDTLASKADKILRMLQNEDFQLWVNELLDEGYELENWTEEELVELYQEICETISYS